MKAAREVKANIRVRNVEIQDSFKIHGKDLPAILGISQIEWAHDPNVKVAEIDVEIAKGGKCARCWIYKIDLGAVAAWPDICKRCAEAVEEWQKGELAAEAKMRRMTSQEKLYAMRFGGILTIAGVVLLLDRLTKAWIRHHFQLYESRRLTSWFYLTFVENTGTAFGLFQGNNRALLLLAFTILAALLYGARGLTERGGFWGAIGVALVLGGAIGNVMDRIHYGQVIDFLDFRVWPVFNIADSAITIGTISLMIGLIWKEPPEEIPLSVSDSFSPWSSHDPHLWGDDRDRFFGVAPGGPDGRARA